MNHYILQSNNNFKLTMDDSSYRLIFYLDKKDEIYHYKI